MPMAMSRRSFLLRFTGAGDRAKGPASAPGGVPGSVRIRVQGACLACGACARACPGKAFRLSTGERAFQLLFLPGLCTDCGLCLKICLAGCLTRVPGEAFSRDDMPDILAEGPLVHCRRCRSATTVLDEGGLCPVCARSRNRIS
jgi:ferredoxin